MDEYSHQCSELETKLLYITEQYESYKRRAPQVITKVEKVVEKVEVIPHDYDEIKFHLEHLSIEYDALVRRPPQVIT